jgi:hypothetical protein
MAKTLDSSLPDGALNILKNGATQLCICSTQPTTYAQATTTYMLALKTGLTSGSFTGPVAGDGGGSSRKISVNATTATTVTNSGTAIYVALCSASVLLAVTSCTSQVLTAGNTVNTPAFKWELGDPT